MGSSPTATSWWRPGVGKTLLAKTIAQSIDGAFTRVQFTPDLLPSDITGSSVFNPQTGRFDFMPGPIFANVLLADELNRTNPRTQSALLEAMAEGQVTIDGASRPLPPPFMVIATQNPLDSSGTFPLPETELDRFLVRISIGMPSPDDEMEILLRSEHRQAEVEAILTCAAMRAMQANVRRVQVTAAVTTCLKTGWHASVRRSRPPCSGKSSSPTSAAPMRRWSIAKSGSVSWRRIPTTGSFVSN